MARIAVATTRQQRWLRAYRRITGSADNSGSLPDYSTGKRTRKFAATATATTATATVRANRFVLAATPTARTGTVTGASTGAPAVFRRYGSSKPGNPTETGSGTATAFPNPLHRNPSRISSSVGSIYKPPGYFLGIDNDPVLLPTDDEAVANSVRSCIKIDEHEHVHVHMHNNECTTGGIVIDGGKDDNDNDNWSDPHEKGLNTEMSLCFLGTGAGSPANIRSTSGAFLRLAGTTFMFDVGEGTQRQFQFAKGSSSISKIEKIFITHLHGDHIFGLPGFLLSLQTSLTQSDDSTRETANTRTKTQTNNKPRRRRRRQTVRDEDDLTVEIYGPPGLFNYIASAITLSCTRLHLLNVHVYELVGGRVRRVVTPPPNAGRHLPRGQQHQHQYRNGHDHRDRDRDPFHSDYPELRHSGGRLRRFEIPCRDGVWNIQYNPLPLSREEITAQMSMSMSMRRNTTTNRNKGLARQQLQQDRIKIRAAEVDHMPGVATFGFVVEEDEPPRNLDVARARALGVSHTDKKYELLKHGFAVTADDGSERRVEPHEVVRAATKKARKIAIVGDNRGWTRQMTEIAANADILVHEATLSEEDPTRGHSTAAMAGRNAAGCDAKLLILNHISPRMESNLSQVVREAYDASRQQLSVLMSFDFMEVVVPWMGFGTNGAEIKSGRTNSDTENLDLDKTNGKE